MSLDIEPQSSYPSPPAAGQGAGRASLQVATQRWIKELGASWWRALRRKPSLAVSWLVVTFVVLAAVVPQLFTSANPLIGTFTPLAPPSAAHLFGTDQLGRDQFARVVYGTSQSLESVVLAVLIGFLVGTSIGLLAGFLGRWVDDVLMRVIDVILSVPSLLIALAIIAAYGVGTLHIAIAVGIGSIGSFARVTRSEVLRLRSAAFVEAGAFAGRGRVGVLGRHVVPNVLPRISVLATLQAGFAILDVAALSFLGFGAAPPTPEWGSLIANGQQYMATAWWMTALPGAVLAVTVIAVNQIARSLDRRRVGIY